MWEFWRTRGPQIIDPLAAISSRIPARAGAVLGRSVTSRNLPVAARLLPKLHMAFPPRLEYLPLLRRGARLGDQAPLEQRQQGAERSGSRQEKRAKTDCKSAGTRIRSRVGSPEIISFLMPLAPQISALGYMGVTTVLRSWVDHRLFFQPSISLISFHAFCSRATP